MYTDKILFTCRQFMTDAPWGQRIDYFSNGGMRTRVTARKSVPRLPVHGPQPRPETPPRSEVGESGHPLGYDPDEDPREPDPSEGYSWIEAVHVMYDMQPNEELADFLWVKLRQAKREFADPDDYYLLYLDFVETLYDRRHLLDLDLPDSTWIRTTMSFFPDTIFWNRKKNSIVEDGPNSNFREFMDHINWYTREYLDREE